MSLSLKLLILSSAAGAFAAGKDNAKFTPRPASSYPARQTVERVTAAAVPYHEPERAKEAFGKLKLFEHGVLPVLVVLQNDSNQTLRLDQMQAEFISAGGTKIEATPAADVRYIGSGRRRSGPLPTGIPRLGGSRKNPLDAFEIEGRAFAAKMLPAGESAHGFFYFQAAYREGARLLISGIRQAATGRELFYFEIPLDAAQ